MNSCGLHNIPDGEIYTGPVETSVNGWVRFSYPAIYGGRVVEGVELKFEKGRVVKATAQENQAFLHEMLASDAGAGMWANLPSAQILKLTASLKIYCLTKK